MIIGNAYYNDNLLFANRDTMPRQAGHSFSSLVIERMLRILLETGEMRRRTLCGKAGLNYKVCTTYLNFLTRLNWVIFQSDDDSGGCVSILSEGIAVLRRLESEEKIPAAELPEFQCYSERGEIEPGSIEKPVSDRSDSRIGPPLRIPNREVINGTDKDGRQIKRQPGHRKCVVIIDDDKDTLVIYKSFLENEECYETVVFSKSMEALQYLALHSDSSDLVLLDIRMPEISGLRIYQAIRALNPNLPIIFLSSIDAAPEVSELFVDAKLGSRIFLRKPVSRSNFIDTVRSVLG